MLTSTLPALLAAMVLAACTDDGLTNDQAEKQGVELTDVGALVVTQTPAPAVTCAAPRIESWTGTADRTNEMYPDDVATTITWQRVSSAGCVDTYAPVGDAHYNFAIVGAVCGQTLTPTTTAVATTNGALTIDRSTSPATFTGHGSTTWSVTWSCRFADGNTESMSFEAGGTWFEASGTVDGTTISGTRVEADGSRCGQGQSSLPCTYAWQFARGN